MKMALAAVLLTLLSAVPAAAQDAAIQKAMQKYKGVSKVTATVVRTKHNAALADDAVLAGTFTFTAPSKMLIEFNGGNDKLYMDGNTYGMVVDGQESVARGATQTQFEDLLKVFRSIFLGDTSVGDVSELAEVSTETNGNLRIITVSQKVDPTQKKRRQMFSSFVLTFDVKTGQFKSLRMNERGENYTHYDFSDFKM